MPGRRTAAGALVADGFHRWQCRLAANNIGEENFAGFTGTPECRHKRLDALTDEDIDVTVAAHLYDEQPQLIRTVIRAFHTHQLAELNAAAASSAQQAAPVTKPGTSAWRRSSAPC